MGFLGGGDPEAPATEDAAAGADTNAADCPSDGTAVAPCPCDAGATFSPEAQATIDRIKADYDAAIAANQQAYDAKVAHYESRNWAMPEADFAPMREQGEALKRQKEEFEAAINECACYGDELLTLANVVYNEAGVFSMQSKTAVAYAYMNRTGGVAREPVGQEISHYKSIDARLDEFDAAERQSFRPDFTDAVKAACKRLRDQNPAANDPTNGATHWVSPSGLRPASEGCAADRFERDGRCFPHWTDARWEAGVEEIQAEGVDPDEFLFFKGVRY
jgi:hypothetical protein